MRRNEKRKNKVGKESKKKRGIQTSSSTFFSFLLDPSHPGETKEKKVWDFDTV